MAKPISLMTIEKRLAILFAAVILVFAVLCGRLMYVQISQGELLTQRAEQQWYRDLPLKAARGKIYDNKGVTIADSIDVFTVYVRPNAMIDREGVCRVLSETLDLDFDSLSKKLKSSVSEVTVKLNVPAETAYALRDLNMDGVYFSLASKRVYPFENLLSKVVGFTTVDNIGQSGLENYYNKYLTGVDGFAYTSTDIRGVETPDTYTRFVPSIAGCDIQLGIDYNIQSFAEEAAESAATEFSAKSASVIVMNVQTGAISAMASYPSYDLSNPPRDDTALLNSLTKNSMITDVYEPGSTFKIFTTAAAIEKGVVSDTDRFFCAGSRTVDGQRIKCWKTKGHGSQTLAEGVKNSCNCVFMDLALRLGTSSFYSELNTFGIGSKTGVDFSGESSGILMNQSSVKTVDLARIGFGQAVAVTPLQLITGVSAIVNGGKLYTPYFVDSVQSGSSTVYKRDSLEKRRIISQATSDLMRSLLLNVVESGGGSKAKVQGYLIGGKTGTAQKYENGAIAQGKYVSSFVGFAPYDNPKYSVLMIVDEPQGYMYYGSLVAAPYAGRIFSKIFEYEGISPTQNEDIKYVTMPNLIGLDYASASSVLKSLNLNAEIMGSSDTVTAQTPVYGEKIPVSDVVLLRFGDDYTDV